jgi:hypothetical protein
MTHLQPRDACHHVGDHGTGQARCGNTCGGSRFGHQLALPGLQMGHAVLKAAQAGVDLLQGNPRSCLKSQQIFDLASPSPCLPRKIEQGDHGLMSLSAKACQKLVHSRVLGRQTLIDPRQDFVKRRESCLGRRFAGQRLPAECRFFVGLNGIRRHDDPPPVANGDHTHLRPSRRS